MCSTCRSLHSAYVMVYCAKATTFSGRVLTSGSLYIIANFLAVRRVIRERLRTVDSAPSCWIIVKIMWQCTVLLSWLRKTGDMNDSALVFYAQPTSRWKIILQCIFLLDSYYSYYSYRNLQCTSLLSYTAKNCMEQHPCAVCMVWHSAFLYRR